MEEKSIKELEEKSTEELLEEMYPVRRYAADALGLLGGPEILPRLAAAVAAESDERVRADLNVARYRIGDRAALEPLLAVANDPVMEWQEEPQGAFLDIV